VTLTQPVRAALLLASGGAVCCSAAGGGIVEFSLNGGRPIEHRLSVAAGDFVELCGKLRQGQTVRWRFDADRPLDFNIHFHEGEKVTTPAQRDATRSASGRLLVAADQDHCWMWSNTGSATVALRARLRADPRGTGK
jgi:hypothetical protein